METKDKKSVFETLSAINCNEHTEKKNDLTYLSWAWAWQMIKTKYPDATYAIYEDQNGRFYHTDGKTCWVKTGVTIEGIEMVEYLPVMNFKNRSIPLDEVTSVDINKTIQRSLTKACARHGLGLYIYAGEDLPEGESSESSQTNEKASQSASKATEVQSPTPKKEAPKKASTVEQNKIEKKMREAWMRFKEIEAVKSMDENGRKVFFANKIKHSVGKTDIKTLTEREWDKVIEDIDMMRVM